MMKVFKLVWSDWDEGSYYLYTHPDKTQKAFEKDVKSLLVKYGNEYLESEDSWAGAHKWICFISDKLPELGYQPVETVNVFFDGGQILKRRDRESTRWKKTVGKELMQKAIEHNDEIERS